MRQFIKLLLKYPAIILNNIYLSIYYGKNRPRDYELEPMLEKSGQRILVLAPHVDDETIGLGGSLIRHRDNLDKVHLVYMADGSGAVSDLSPEELVEERKKEARQVQAKLGLEPCRFMDIRDCQVSDSLEISSRLVEILEEVRPDIIYSPHLIDGHIDHVNTSRALIKALETWDRSFENIYLYEVNTSINPRAINAIVGLDQKAYEEKQDLYKIFQSQYVMGFDAFDMVDRFRARLVENSLGAETFTRLSLEELRNFDAYLRQENFDPNSFRQLSSRYNLILSYIKNKSTKEKYLKNLRTGF